MADEAELNLKSVPLFPAAAFAGFVFATLGSLGANEIRELFLGVKRGFRDPGQECRAGPPHLRPQPFGRRRLRLSQPRRPLRNAGAQPKCNALGTR